MLTAHAVEGFPLGKGGGLKPPVTWCDFQLDYFTADDMQDTSNKTDRKNNARISLPSGPVKD